MESCSIMKVISSAAIRGFLQGDNLTKPTPVARYSGPASLPASSVPPEVVRTPESTIRQAQWRPQAVKLDPGHSELDSSLHGAARLESTMGLELRPLLYQQSSPWTNQMRCSWQLFSSAASSAASPLGALLDPASLQYVWLQHNDATEVLQCYWKKIHCLLLAFI